MLNSKNYMGVCSNQTINKKNMPLLRNGEPYTLTKANKDAIRATVGNKFPVKFKMPSSWMRPDPVNKGRIIRPPGVNLSVNSVIPEDGEFVKWTYGRSFRPTKNGKELKSSDGMISFGTELSVGANQMDLLFYLIFCNPSREGSPHANPSTMSLYVLENLEKESGEILAKEAMLSAAVHFLSNEWSEVRVRKVAAAMGIPFATNIELMGEKEIRLRVVNLIKRSPRVLEQFDILTRMNDEIEIRAVIQWLQDKQLLVYEDSWYLLKLTPNQRPERVRKICDLQANRNPLDSLVYFLKTNPEIWEIVSNFDGNLDEELTVAAKTEPGTKKSKANS